jgi:hypothetical protein
MEQDLPRKDIIYLAMMLVYLFCSINKQYLNPSTKRHWHIREV